MSSLALADAFAVHQAPCGRVLRCASLPSAARHLFSTRDVDVRAEAPGLDAAWAAVAAAIDLPASRLLRARQVHGRDVVVVRRQDGADGAEGPLPAAWRDVTATGLPVADIVVSDDPSVGITVRVADCVPVLLADARLGVVAAAHAGWRGTALGVARIAVDALGRSFGSRPGDLRAAIGPSIGPEVYEVGEEVRALFEAEGHGAPAVQRWFKPGRNARPHLDVWQANVDQLVEAGVPARQIACARACTASSPGWFFSHRREGASAGRMVAAIRAYAP